MTMILIRPVRVGSTFERGLRDYNHMKHAPNWRRYVDKLPIPWRHKLVAADWSLDRADPVKRMHYEFGISTNERGAETLKLIETRRSAADANVLDIGCAYGGFLVAALQRGARKSVGLDINPKLLDLARANLDDYGMRERCQLLLGDVIAPSTCQGMEPFDVIICNDVIEHVADPDKLAERIVSLLAPSGSVAFLEIPNLRSSRYMASDGHFQLCGITALEHDDAEAYFHCFNPGVEYTVGHVLERDAYRAMFESRGCTVEFEPYPRAATSFQICQDDYASFETKLATFTPASVPAPLLAKVKQQSMVFRDDARSDVAAVKAGTMTEHDYLLRHYDPFWRLFVRKN